MQPMDRILETARKKPARIVLPEGEDPRIVSGALRALRDGIAQPVLIGPRASVDAQVKEAGGNAGEIEIIDPATHDKTGHYEHAYHKLREHKGLSLENAKRAVADPLVFAALMVREGDAQGTIGGAVATTAATVRAALQVIGRGPGVSTVSSFFLMLMNQEHHPKQGAIIFADCGLIVEPSSEELAQIALSSAESFKALLGEDARVAFLSFSTMGSARHKRVEHVAEAVSLARAQNADLVMDGEFQFDSAFVPAVAASKAKDSAIQGDANVFVFPSLEAGNIGYKIAQRIGGAGAIGPILQGLNRPANDLSRGCSADDVYNLIAVTGAQAASL